MPDWIKRGWKTYAKKPVKNLEIWKAIKKILDYPEEAGLDIDFNFLWTKGHVKLDGNESISTKYNNECDERLNVAMDNYTLNEGDYERYCDRLFKELNDLHV